MDLQAQQAAMSQDLGPNHPDMAALLRQKGMLEQQLRSAVDKRDAWRARALRGGHAAGRRPAAEARGDRDARASRLRDLGARYEFLKGDVDTARQLHDSLLKQQLETAVNAQLAPTNVRVVERAEVPARPSRPNVPLNLALGLHRRPRGRRSAPRSRPNTSTAA